MEDFDDTLVCKQVRERGEVAEGDGIDGDRFLGRCNLHQAEPRMIGALTQELGVDRNGVEGGRAVAKRCKIRFCGNIHAPPSSRGTPTRHGVG